MPQIGLESSNQPLSDALALKCPTSRSLTINSVAHDLSTDQTWTVTATPSGSAGGDLTGTYPNPTLTAIGSATGPTGSATVVPIVTIDTKGRVTALTSTTITGVVPGGSAGGALGGTYPNPSLAVATASGVYTPTRSAEVNLDSNVTMSEAQYMRVGNTVTVSGRFTADPTAPATPTSFEFTLPVASNIGATEDVAGVAFCGAIAGQGAAISGSVANDTAVVSWIAGDVTSQGWSFVFSFQLI